MLSLLLWLRSKYSILWDLPRDLPEHDSVQIYIGYAWSAREDYLAATGPYVGTDVSP